MIDEQGWVSWAQQHRDLRQDKIWRDEQGVPIINKARGIAWHSQEGYNLQVMIDIHQGANYKSHVFYIDMGGNLHQFQPVTASAWVSGTRWGNTFFWPVELEGVYSDFINRPQIACAIKLIGEWADYDPKHKVTRWSMDYLEPIPSDANFPTMVEHREIDEAEARNAGATACPSERYVPLWEKLPEVFGRPEPEEPVAVDDDVDDRLREVLQNRMRLRRAGYTLLSIADAPDAGEVEAYVNWANQNTDMLGG